MEPFGKRFRVPVHVIKRYVSCDNDNDSHICLDRRNHWWINNDFQINIPVADIRMHFFNDIFPVFWQRTGKSHQIDQYGLFGNQWNGTIVHRWWKFNFNFFFS